MEIHQYSLRSAGQNIMFFHWILLLFALTFLALNASAQQIVKPVDQQLQDIDSVLNRILKDQHLPGFSVAIVSEDRIIYSKGFGYRDVKQKLPVTANTQFAIGSTTKAFTAGLIGLLEKEGKLSFEGKATHYLPNLSFFNDEMNKNITVRDLMAHRTGFLGSTASWYLFSTNDDENLLRRIKYMAPQFGVREKYIYSNYNYFIQGMIVKKLSGNSWENNIKSKFLDPLDMKNSTTTFAEFRKNKDASLSYDVDRDTIKEFYNPSSLGSMAPAGGIYSTANDMGNWLKMWINNGKYNNREILPSTYVKEATSSQMVASTGYPGEFKDIYLSNSGLGWGIASHRGYYTVAHSGYIDGYSSLVGFFPTEKIGIVVLSNQRSSANYVILNSIADRLLNVTPFNWNTRLKKSVEASKPKAQDKVAEPKKPEPKAITIPAHALKQYVGKFYNPLYDTVYVTLKNDSLFAGVGTEKVLLMHEYRDVFTTRGLDFRKVNFRFSDMDKVDEFTVPLEGKPAVFKYVPGNTR